MKTSVTIQYKISNEEFFLLSKFIKEKTGINLTEKKKMLVVARLSKRLRELGFESFADYYDFITRDSLGNSEIDNLINRITTNKTDFYRERHHFEFLMNIILPQIYLEGKSFENRRLRIWSAGCSSGEEPYTIAMTLSEYFKDKVGWDIKILATDLDTEMLDKAKNGVYSSQAVEPIPQEYLQRYFKKGIGVNDGLFQVKESLKKMIIFKRHNLVNEQLFFKQPLDMIFCRNVIIYFDDYTKEKVISQFYEILKNGGYLFLGHSESLLGSDERFKLLGNSVYQKLDWLG